MCKAASQIVSIVRKQRRVENSVSFAHRAVCLQTESSLLSEAPYVLTDMSKNCSPMFALYHDHVTIKANYHKSTHCQLNIQTHYFSSTIFNSRLTYAYDHLIMQNKFIHYNFQSPTV